MPVFSWLVFTPAQRSQVIAENSNTEYDIIPRAIDNPSASSLVDPLIIVGNSVAPTRVVTGDGYAERWGPTWVASLPARDIDSDVIFLPPSD